MKLHRILLTSVLLNMILIGLVGYLWGARISPGPLASISHSTSPLESPAVAPVSSSPSSPPSFAISPAASQSTISPSNSLLGVAGSQPGFNPPVSDYRRTAPSPSLPTVDASRPPAPSLVESTPTAPSSVSETAPDQPVNSSRPGNTLLFHGIQASVSEAISTNGTAAAPALGVDFSPASPSTNGATNSSANGAASSADGAPTSAGAGGIAQNATGTATDASPATANSATAKRSRTSTASGTPTSSDSTSPGGTSPTGLTTEEELFRMRWGWAAYDAARLAALKQAGQ